MKQPDRANLITDTPGDGHSSAAMKVAVVRHSSYDPQALANAEEQMTEFQRIHSAQPGYAGNVVIDLGEGERFVVTLWESQQHAAQARAVLTPVVQELLRPLERTPSRLLGVGHVLSTDLALMTSGGADTKARGLSRPSSTEDRGARDPANDSKRKGAT